MSGPTKGGNFIIQSGVSDRLLIPMGKLLDGSTRFPDPQTNMCQLLTVHDAVDMSTWRRSTNKGVLEMPAPDATVSDGVRSLLAMARAVGNHFPSPVVLSDEGGDVTVAQLLQEAEDILEIEEPIRCQKIEMGELCDTPENDHHSLTHTFTHPDVECQAPRGSDRICGLTKGDIIHSQNHSYPGKHTFVPKRAGVAQSAEQGFRKAEVVGSTPIPSSTGFSTSERDLMAMIVRKTNALIQSRDIIRKKQEEVDKLRNETNGRIGVLNEQIRLEQERAKVYEQDVRNTENQFRTIMIQSAIVQPAPVVEAPVPVEEEPLDLGRGE